MQRRIKVLVVKPNKLPELQEIDNTLSAKQKVVGGYIEYATREHYPDVVFICNESGKLEGLPLNRSIGDDIIAGDFIIAGDDPEIGEDRSLTEEQIKKYKLVFGKESIEKTNREISNLLLGYEI